LCQPDPEYSKSDYCKHKDRNGCCFEINPTWDTVPGYKHTADFCDKLCMPESPDDKLAMCTPPKEFADWQAEDPRDAIDRFYEKNPSQCSERINARTWAEQNCQENEQQAVYV
jgi:hypothetical protein